MEDKEILELGFKKKLKTHGNHVFTEYVKGNGFISIEISGTTLVEITQGNEFITVTNCNTITDLKQLMRLFNIN